MVKKDTKKIPQKDFFYFVKQVILTEKATKLIEFENKLIFEVLRETTKPQLKLLFENQYKKPIKHIRTLNTIKGKKHAIISFKEEGVASNLASELKLI